MLDALAEKLQNALKGLAGRTIVDKAAVEAFIKDLQKALIQSDVDVKLVFELSERIRQRALAEDQRKGFTAKDHVLKVIYEELVTIVGQKAEITQAGLPRLMLIGLFGAGKTTTAGKLAKWYKKRGFRVALVGADTYRPAAQAQICQLAEAVGVDCHATGTAPVRIVKEAMQKFPDHVLIVDTAGRNALDSDMIQELHVVKGALNPDEVILTVAADLGQEAGRQAREFSQVGISGVIVTKMEGTAKGGGALTSCAVAGVPIKMIGVGEKLDDLEPFEPNGFISRILGWGDIAGLVNKAEEIAREQEINPEEMLLREFDLNTFYKQLEAAKSLGPLGNVLQMMGAGGVPKELLVKSEEKLKKYKFILDSINRVERKNPDLIGPARIKRIAKGAGVTEADVKEMLKHFYAAKKMVKVLKKGRLPRNMGLKDIQALRGMGKLKRRL